MGQKRRPGDPARIVARSEQIRAKLGWRPRYDDISGDRSSCARLSAPCWWQVPRPWVPVSHSSDPRSQAPAPGTRQDPVGQSSRYLLFASCLARAAYRRERKYSIFRLISLARISYSGSGRRCCSGKTSSGCLVSIFYTSLCRTASSPHWLAFLAQWLLFNREKENGCGASSQGEYQQAR